MQALVWTPLTVVMNNSLRASNTLWEVEQLCTPVSFQSDIARNILRFT
jgi:hypothetical protein